MSLLSIDTLKIRIPAPDIKQIGDVIEWEHIISKDGEIKSSIGRYENLLLNLCHGSLYIEGSIPKLVKGDNITGISFCEFVNAIKNLETALSVELGTGIVIRIDLAVSVPIREQADKYIACFEYAPRFVKNFVKKNSIQFMQKQQVLKFYDKVLEVTNKDAKRVFDFDTNFLRYELMLKYQSIKRLFGTQFTLNDLLIPKNYSQLIIEYAKRYNSIIKSKCEYFNPQTIEKPLDIIKYLASEGIDSVGIDNVFKMIERTPVPHNNFRKRMKDSVKSILNQIYIIDNPLVDEFEGKLEQRCLNALYDLVNYSENEIN